MTTGVPPLTVLQLSDLHLFSNVEQDLLGLNTHQSLQVVLQAIKNLATAPDLILITGDLAQDASAEAYHDIYCHFEDFDIPVYAIPGNHDDPNTMAKILTAAPFMSARCFSQRGWQFVLLDSSVRSQVKGALSEQTLAQLHQTLSASHLPTAIALHHPPYPIQSAWLDDGLENYQAFWQVIDGYPQVKIVLNGHVHQSTTFSRRGVQYLSTPSTCVQFKPRSLDFAVDDCAPGFRLLSLFADGSCQSWVERVPIAAQPHLNASGY